MRTILDGSAGLPERVDRFARSALADRTLRKNFSFVDELDRELKLYESAEPAWR